MKHFSKHRHHSKKTAVRRVTKHTVKHHSTTKGGLFSWLTSRLPFMKGGALTEDYASVDADSMLLPANMRGVPQGVDASTAPAFHTTTGGSRKQRKQRKQRKSQRGGMAPVDMPSMLLPSEMYANAYLNKEWPAAGGSCKQRKQRKH